MFRKLIEESFEFPIAETLHTFWPMGCNLSGNPHLHDSALSRLSVMDVGDFGFSLIGFDEEEMAQGVSIITEMF